MDWIVHLWMVRICCGVSSLLQSYDFDIVLFVCLCLYLYLVVYFHFTLALLCLNVSLYMIPVPGFLVAITRCWHYCISPCICRVPVQSLSLFFLIWPAKVFLRLCVVCHDMSYAMRCKQTHLFSRHESRANPIEEKYSRMKRKSKLKTKHRQNEQNNQRNKKKTLETWRETSHSSHTIQYNNISRTANKKRPDCELCTNLCKNIENKSDSWTNVASVLYFADGVVFIFRTFYI